MSSPKDNFGIGKIINKQSTCIDLETYTQKGTGVTLRTM